MSAFNIKRWFAKHNGGTKFYQVILIEQEGAGGTTSYIITHWGSYSLGEIHLPKHGGQSKMVTVKPSTANWEANRIMDGKKGRGYRFEIPNVDVCEDQTIFQMKLEEYLKRDQASEIFTALTGDFPTVASKENADIDHLFGIKSKPAPAPEPDRGEAWGSW